MGQRPVTELGRAMLAELPPFLQDVPEYQAIIHASARELERMEGCLEQVRAQFNPATADALLSAWETEVRLPAGGLGATLEQRQARVLSRLKQLEGSSEGRDWEAQVTEVGGAGWDYLEHVAGDAGTPPEDTIRITLPFPPATGRYDEALREIRVFTPAHLAIEFTSAAGFILDQSQLDLETFAGN